MGKKCKRGSFGWIIYRDRIFLTIVCMIGSVVWALVVIGVSCARSADERNRLQDVSDCKSEGKNDG